LLGSLPGGGAAAVAIYEAAIKVTNLTDVPTASMANILFPQSARRAEEGKEAVKQLYEKAVGAILAFMVPAILFVLLFADWIILIVAGSEYVAWSNVLRITIFFGLVMPYVVQFGTVLDSIGKPHVNFAYTLMSLVFTVTFNLVFISLFGVYGAAVGTLSAYTVTFLIMQVYLHKQLNVNPLRPFGYMIGFYKKIFSFGKKALHNRSFAAALREES
jgi:O-antigen/teichoic acid export membrane protein